LALTPNEHFSAVSWQEQVRVGEMIIFALYGTTQLVGFL